MTANPENVADFELPPLIETPSFVIDEDAPKDVAEQIRLDQLWLLRRPATRMLVLRQFEEGADIPESSIWRRLTDKDTCRHYGFDSHTEAAIRKDETYRILIEHPQGKTSDVSAGERTLKIRLRRLEIFLDRAKQAKSLGSVSLQEAE